MRALRAKPIPVLLAAALVAVIAGVHFQQYVDFISEVPTVGVLFLLNAAGGAGLAIALLSNEAQVRRLGALGALGLAIGSLISIAIALGGSFFGYSEPTLRLPIVIAILAEAAAIPTLILLMLHDSRAADAHRPSTVDARPSR
jgi:hypothetical protein